VEHRGRSDSDLLSAALGYAAAGVPVFPCTPLGKTPMTRRGFKDASVRPSRIASWWRWSPDSNIGLVTGAAQSSIDVLDIDVHPGGDGFDALSRLQGAGLVDSWTRIVRSPAGGLHLYFPANDSSLQKSWAVPKSHVDFLAAGSYVLAPPSRVRTRTGAIAQYELVAEGRSPGPVDGWRLAEVLRPPRSAPELGAAVRAFAASSHPSWDPGQLADWVAVQPEGNRNRGLFWAACRLAGASRSVVSLPAGLLRR